MLTEQQQTLGRLLEEIARTLDISPTDYKRAASSYGAVGQWLIDGYDDGAYHGSIGEPDIYPQGSISLGTVVRPLPLQDGKDADFDVDLVCELQASNIARTSPQNARAIKHQVGNRIKANGIYEKKLESEGRRCWTLIYAKDAGVGFHIDILPSVPDPNRGEEITRKGYLNPYLVSDYTETAVGITHWPDKRSQEYEWKSSNPRGYAKWFKSRNTSFDMLAVRQKQQIFESTQDTRLLLPMFNTVDDVPDELVRTPLQRAIQILKRHRNVRFKDEPTCKPISVILTTLAAWLYQGEQDVFTALVNIVNKIGHHAGLLENGHAALHESVAKLELITRKDNGEWLIPNPVDPEENFADRWHAEDHARAKAFFRWVHYVQQDINDALLRTDPSDLKGLLAGAFGERMLNEASEKSAPDSVASKSLVPAAPRKLSRFNVPHRQAPLWPVRRFHSVSVSGQVKNNGSWNEFNSDSNPLPKHLDLLFRANTNVPRPFDVFWQIVNTGSEAERAHGLRGEIVHSKTAGAGGLTQKENTVYAGTHWVECFIVKSGECVARSGEFVVNIQ